MENFLGFLSFKMGGKLVFLGNLGKKTPPNMISFNLKYLKSQSNESAFTNLKEYNVGSVLEAAFSHRRENLSVSCYLSNYYCSKKLILSLLDVWVSLISLRSKFYFSLFFDMKIWESCAYILNYKSAAPGPI